MQLVETASFQDGAAGELVADVVATDHGLFAVGTRSGSPAQGLVWRSLDGTSWEDVTPVDMFERALLRSVYATADGALIVLGAVRPRLPRGPDDETPAAWRSEDGLTWADASAAVPGDYVGPVEYGPQGYLVVVRGPDADSLWYSDDGTNWTMSLPANSGRIWFDLGAGPEGFVAIGSNADGSRRIVIASSDGREWFEAAEPPPNIERVAPHGPDWMGVAGTLPIDIAKNREAPVWFSENGLDWREIGPHPLLSVSFNEDTTCAEYVSDLLSAGEVLVTAAVLLLPMLGGHGRHLWHSANLDRRKVVGVNGSSRRCAAGQPRLGLLLGPRGRRIRNPGRRGGLPCHVLAIDPMKDAHRHQGGTHDSAIWRYRTVVATVALAAVLTMLLPGAALGRTNTKDKITVFLHGFNGHNCTQDWRELMLDMRANGFTGPFYAVRFLSADSECDLSGIPNAFNVGLFRFGAHTGPYGHRGPAMTTTLTFDIARSVAA